MAVTPNTVLKLLKCPLELDNLNQLTFASAEAQQTYFNSLPSIEIDNITYQRKDNVVRFPAHIDTIINYNYVMYQNSNYSNKWFYAYIDKMEYLNDSTTLITISTDCYQTWMFDLTFKQSYIEREHVNNDTRGLHTVPENLEKGDFIHNGNMVRISFTTSDPTNNIPSVNKAHIVVASTKTLTGTQGTSLFKSHTGHTYGGVYSGASYYVFEDASNVTEMLAAIAAEGLSDNIIGMFMVPDGLTGYGTITWTTTSYTDTDGTSYVWSSKELLNSSSATDMFLGTPYTIAKATTLNGYTPRNKKLLTGEFMYLFVTNFQGATQKFDYELFTSGGSVTSNDCAFQCKGVITPGCSIYMYPANYQSLNTFDSGLYGIPCGKLPVCNWNVDQYTNWLTQSGLNVKHDASSVGETFFDKGLISAVGESVGIVTNAVKSLTSSHQSKYLPNASMGDTNNGDVMFSSAHAGYGIYPMSIKAEYASIIDSFFDHFGYKVVTNKIPNITGRANWNYVKTIECNVVGDVPQEDLQVIKDMFNNGVTFWHNPATFLDYSQNNGII